jgi:hypothetical protein
LAGNQAIREESGVTTGMSELARRLQVRAITAPKYPLLEAALVSYPVQRQIHRVLGTIARRFAAVETEDLYGALMTEAMWSGNTAQLREEWIAEHPGKPHNEIGAWLLGVLKKQAEDLAWRLNAERMPLAQQNLITLHQLAAALRWSVPDAPRSTRRHWPQSQRMTDVEDVDLIPSLAPPLFPVPAIKVIKGWAPERRELFRLAWVEFLPWEELAEATGKTPAAARQMALYLHQRALDARSSWTTIRFEDADAWRRATEGSGRSRRRRTTGFEAAS